MNEHIYAGIRFWENAPLVPVFGLYINLYLIIAAGAVLLRLLCYVLRSRALQRLSGDRRLRGGFWAWFPMGFWWVMGNIADDYSHKARGKQRHRRSWLLWLSISMLLLNGALAVCLLGIYCYISPLVLVLAARILFVTLPILWLARLIFGIFALLSIYTSCDPDKAVANLIVSILLPVSVPFILFACRNRNFGMPPEKMHMAIPNTWKPHT